MWAVAKCILLAVCPVQICAMAVASRLQWLLDSFSISSDGNQMEISDEISPACQEESLGCHGWSWGLNKRPQDHCKTDVGCFLQHMLILSTGLCKDICFAYSAHRTRIMTWWFGQLVQGLAFCFDLYRLTFPEFLFWDKFSPQIWEMYCWKQRLCNEDWFFYINIWKYTHTCVCICV